ncbi:MAG: hypothetical protein NTX03_02130 [Bacteroidetes bacterium]|nr:hypothetical protein [Bacteroidota bacterium]
MESSKQNTIKKNLKVYYKSQLGRKPSDPMIRLSGKYLIEKNFKVGDSIEVCIEQGKITIIKLN